MTRDYKTFVALSTLTDGPIRVVIVRFEDGGWIPDFCTDSNATVRDILEVAAARWAIEEQFHEIQEVWGAGQQQVRNVWSNIGCWNLNGWLFTLVELCAWDRPATELADRRDRPWDHAHRRPSHADRRRQFARIMLRNEFPPTRLSPPETDKYQALLETLLTLCT